MKQTGVLAEIASGEHAQILSVIPVEALLAAALPWEIPSSFLEPLQIMLDSMTEQAAVIAPDGTIILTNDDWYRCALLAAHKDLHVNGNYHAFLEDLVAEGHEAASAIQDAWKDIDEGKRSHFTCIFEAIGRNAGYRFRMVLTPVVLAGTQFLFVSRSDITRTLELERRHRVLDLQLLQAQDEERRRMARDLHDSTSQLIVGLQLNLFRLGRAGSNSEVEAVLADCREITRTLHAEIRSVTFLAHPPALENQSLGGALEELARGFAARTGLEIETNLAEIAGLSPLLEASLYRVAQEALANVHRHAQATRASISTKQIRGYAYLQIRDNGRGLAAAKLSSTGGLGIASMQERLAALGGKLSIRKPRVGTLLVARVPHRSPRPADAADGIRHDFGITQQQPVIECRC